MINDTDFYYENVCKNIVNASYPRLVQHRAIKLIQIEAYIGPFT